MATGLENLKIYQMARSLELQVHEITKKFPSDEIYRSVDQLRRSSSSVTNNIVEGYNKQSLKDKVRIFNDIVKAEANETRADLEISLQKKFHKNKETIDNYTELIKALSGFISFLRKSGEPTELRNLQTSNLQTTRRVLAIDPGFDRVGVAILEENRVLFSSCIITDRRQSHELRLLAIGEEIKKIIKKWKPDAIAIETLFFNQNVSTAIKVAEARGVIIYEAVRMGIEIYEYSPQAIKIAVTSYGKASKSQVKNMLEKLVALPKSIHHRLDDELDAIAIGITHLATKNRL